MSKFISQKNSIIDNIESNKKKNMIINKIK